MLIKSSVTARVLAMMIATVPAMSMVAGAGAEEEGGSAVPVSEASRYLGEWTVSFEMQGQVVSMSLRFLDVDGTLGATLRSPAQPQPLVISNISTVSRGLKLEYSQPFGETEIPITMVVRLERGELHGDITAEGGLFSAEIHGDKTGKIPGRATLDFLGIDVKVTYGPLKVGEEDYRRLGEVKDGEVFEYVYSRVTKLFTDADLLFGDALILAGNAGPDYPGVYSLWLKRVGNGWRLVFNEEADVWGTQHDPSRDVAEIPLTLSRLAEEEKRFLIELDQQGDIGVLRLAWGPNEWIANFKLAL